MTEEDQTKASDRAEILAALDRLWTHLEKSEKSEKTVRFGSSEITPQDRQFRVVKKLRELICPHSDEILRRVSSGEASVVSVISDFATVYFVGLGLPVATLAKEIARVGVERFCRDPDLILPDANV